jgi:hypothetical protein
VRVPFADGSNSMETAQLAFGLRVPQVFLLIKKSPGFEPVNATLENVTATVPLLETVMVWAALKTPTSAV